MFIISALVTVCGLFTRNWWLVIIGILMMIFIN